MNRNDAWELLKKYNKEQFHLRHGLVVEGVMRYFAKELGYSNEEDFWGIVGLLHDLDFEMYPLEHCVKTQELMKKEGVDEKIIKSCISHGYGLTNVNIEPTHQMEKVLFAVDELTGLIGATAMVRPSKSTKDMELSSVKKKFKDLSFAAGCSRDVIKKGAEMMGVELDELIEKTILAMRECEDSVNATFMEIIPQIQAYFDAKTGDVNLIDNYFAEDICIEDTGENDVIKGFDNCKKWLKDKSQQYQMETKFVDVKNEENGIIKVSVIVTGNFAPENYPFDYYFSIINEKIKMVKIIYMGE